MASMVALMVAGETPDAGRAALAVLNTVAQAIAGLIVLTAVLLLLKRALLAERTRKSKDLDLAEVLRELRASGELSEEQSATARRRLLGIDGPGIGPSGATRERGGPIGAHSANRVQKQGPSRLSGDQGQKSSF